MPCIYDTCIVINEGVESVGDQEQSIVTQLASKALLPSGMNTANAPSLLNCEHAVASVVTRDMVKSRGKSRGRPWRAGMKTYNIGTCS